MAYDLLLIERGDGGDFKINPTRTDLETVTGFQNMVYLALFGGNVEQSTKQYLAGEQRFDWWGNSTLFRNRQNSQMNSTTERILRDTALNSQGRLIIEQAVKSDLKFMEDFAQVEVFVSLVDVDRVEINVKLIKPNSEADSEITFIWDSTLNELIENKYIVV